MGGIINKNLKRPKKSAAGKARRLRVQQRRLIALGMPEKAVMKLSADKVRELLRRPCEIGK